MDQPIKLKTYKGYDAQINYSEEDDIFYGTVLNIKDLVTFECPTIEKGQQEFESAIDDYLNFKNFIK